MVEQIVWWAAAAVMVAVALLGLAYGAVALRVASVAFYRRFGPYRLAGLTFAQAAQVREMIREFRHENGGERG